MSTYPEAWVPQMTEAWTQHPPDPGDADYLAYLDAQVAEAARLAAVIEAAPTAPGLWTDVPNLRDDPDSEVDTRSPEEQVTTLGAVTLAPDSDRGTAGG